MNEMKLRTARRTGNRETPAHAAKEGTQPGASDLSLVPSLRWPPMGTGNSAVDLDVQTDK